MPTTIVACSLAALISVPVLVLDRVDAQSVEVPGVSRQAPKAPGVMPLGAINTSLGVLSGASASFLSLPADSFGVEAMGQASPLAAALSGRAIDALSPVMGPAERLSNESFVPPVPMA